MTLVFNASPLIVLSKAGLLDSVLSLVSEAYVPQPVVEELVKVNNRSDTAKVWI